MLQLRIKQYFDNDPTAVFQKDICHGDLSGESCRFYAIEDLNCPVNHEGAINRYEWNSQIGQKSYKFCQDNNLPILSDKSPHIYSKGYWWNRTEYKNFCVLFADGHVETMTEKPLVTEP